MTNRMDKSTPGVLAIREKQDRALHLRRMRWTLAAIAADTGYKSAGAAFGAIEAALSRQPAADAAVVRAEAWSAFQASIVELWNLYRQRVLIVSAGVETDQADLMFQLGTLIEIRRQWESMRKMFGTDAPTRKVVEVVTEDTIEAEIARLIAELATNDHGEAPQSVAAGREATEAPMGHPGGSDG